MKLPRGLARFNRRVTNRVQGVYAWALPPWAVIVHRGRRTGRTYRTPVVAFTRGKTIAVAVLYGESSDWVRNVLAGGGELVRAGRTHQLRDARLVRGRDESLPRGVRPLARLCGSALVADLGESRGGFGPGPRA
jgi:deazaflavin-dependent oxidoreductase (nitroreductase family)